MKQLALTIIAAALILTGCKKEKDAEPLSSTIPPTASSGMYQFPVSIGSYWVYEAVDLDSNYTVLSISSTDSSYIANDTMIGGIQYFVKKNINLSGTTSFLSSELTGIIRDSAGYIVNQLGQFIKHDDFTNILSTYTSTTPPYTLISRMAHEDSVVNCPAGSFNTINYLGKVTITDTAFTGNPIKYNNHIMADSVGLIYKTVSFYNAPNKVGIRLLRYHIAP